MNALYPRSSPKQTPTTGTCRRRELKPDQGTVMNTHHFLMAAATAFGLSTAIAQEATPDTWKDTPSTRSRAEVQQELEVARARGELDHVRQYDSPARNFKSTLTRAEVLADLEIWRRSGLAAQGRGEASPDFFSEEYRQAHARYAAMKASPEFAALVQTIARERGETVLAGRPANPAVR
ncbi:DUF4148 domain-containing protein [Caldimonas mangrovi]|nr:DUF4148 domain-containing protein [Caldimonas mangrovi]